MRRLTFAAIALITFTGSAKAAVQTFTDSAAFFAALGSTPSFTETYQGPAVNSQIPQGGTLNGLIYNFSPPVAGGQGIGRIDGDTPTSLAYNGFGIGGDPTTIQTLAVFRDPTGFGEDPNESVFYPGESFTVTREGGGPFYAIGAFFNGSDPGGDGTQAGDYFIETSVGTAFNDLNAVVGDGGPNPTLYFVGLISDTPFDSATFGVSPNSAFGFNLDNLTFTTQQVGVIPEPATLMVLGGMLSLGGLAYRRRRTPA
jgi:hypothetical protein